MKLRSLILLTVLLLALALTAPAADISGKWTAQVPGRGGDLVETTFDFKVEGEKLAGTQTTPRGQVDLKDGKVSGDTVSFKTVLEFQGNSVSIVYEGKVVGAGEIKFTRKREGGDRTSEFTAKKAT